MTQDERFGRDYAPTAEEVVRIYGQYDNVLQCPGNRTRDLEDEIQRVLDENEEVMRNDNEA